MIALLTELAENVEDKQFQLTFTNERKNKFACLFMCCCVVL